MGIKTDTGLVFSCVHNYSLCNKLRARKKQYWINVIDSFDAEYLCFKLLFLASNPSFSVCMHWLGH